MAATEGSRHGTKPKAEAQDRKQTIAVIWGGGGNLVPVQKSVKQKQLSNDLQAANLILYYVN
jgi:hypothetical protein